MSEKPTRQSAAMRARVRRLRAQYRRRLVIVGILFFILGCEFFINYRLVFRKKGVR